MIPSHHGGSATTTQVAGRPRTPEGPSAEGFPGGPVRKVLVALRYQLAVPLAVLVLWEAISRSGVIPIHLFPPPSTVLGGAGPRILSSSLIYESLAASLMRVVIGWTLASVVGISLGLIAGYFMRMRLILYGPINAGRSMPPAALVPVVIMWFGTRGTSAVILIFTIAIWPVIINTIAGVEHVPPRQREVARTMGATTGQEIRTVVLPAALPTAATGMRIAMGLAWMAVVVSELVGVSPGLGHFLSVSRAQGDTTGIVFALFVIGLVAVGLDQVFSRLKDRIVRF